LALAAEEAIVHVTANETFEAEFAAAFLEASFTQL
jgi:hypothetical protein